jgi:glycosyltransferase involved in cell wall biosynthesis
MWIKHHGRNQGSPMKLLYISRRRAEELPMLESLSKEGKIDLVQMDITSGKRLQKIKNIFIVFRLAVMHKPNVILSEGAGFCALIGLLACILGKSQLLFRVKGDPYQQLLVDKSHERFSHKLNRYLNFLAFKISLKYCTMVLPISNIIKNTLQNTMSFEKPMHVIYIPTREISCEGKNLGQPAPDENFVITVSNFQFLKKVGPLLRAIPPVSQVLQSLEIVWYILGDGEYLKDIKKVINDAEAHNTVKLTGRVNPVGYYQKAQAHLYFSGMDATPNALLESFCFGVPVVVNNDFPAKDIAIEDFNVVSMKSYNDADVATCIHTILHDTAVRQQLTDNSQKFLSEQFSVESISKKLWTTLSQLKTHD